MAKNFDVQRESEKRLEISGELDSLALKMRSIAAKMQNFEDAAIVDYGSEMESASELAREWAKFMRKQSC